MSKQIHDPIFTWREGPAARGVSAGAT